MSDYFLFGDIDTRSFNVYVFPMNIDDIPPISQEKITVPGRHGSLLYTGRRFENVTHRYGGVAYSNAYQTADVALIRLRNALMKYEGYTELKDSFHTEEFYMARYAGGLNPEYAIGRDMIKFVIEFDRMPQRYLVSGKTSTTISSSSSTITNPTNFPSDPLIRIYGSGSCTIAGRSISIGSASGSSPPSYIDIDCEMKDCYSGALNCNKYVTLQGQKFPTLNAGSNYISKGSVSSIVITPRWWQI